MNAKPPTFDLSNLNQPIFSCLESINRLSHKLVGAERINIIFETLSPQALHLFHIDSQTEQKGVWSQVLAQTNAFHYEFAHTAKYYSEADFSLFLTSGIPSRFYHDIKHSYHIPLHWSDRYHCVIQFLRAKNNAFTHDEIENLTQLSKLVSETITHLFSIAQANHEKYFFEQEHLRDHLLVKITNTVISVHSLEKMVKQVSQDMIDYFNLDYVGLIIPSYEQTKQTLYVSHKLADSSLNQQNLLINFAQSFIKQIITQSPLTVHSTENLHEQYHKNDMLSMMQTNDLQSLYCLPLNLANKQQGALLLAHHNDNIFSHDNIDLFTHIADRVTIAIDNIQSYQKVSNLNHSLTNENLYLTEEICLFDSYPEIIGHSQAIQKVFEQVEMVADSSSSVLLLGETGTGKELFAKAIHQLSHRRDKRMIKINCSAVPSNLLESELFGHERGAFTNANTKRIGRFELAHDSTLLLDEIGDVPLELQPKLLRVLQEKEIERLGSNKTISVNTRVIAATNCNLEKMVTDKTFRADLYYRLNVFPIVIPPLRERKEDIPALAQFFTQKFASQMKRDITSISAKTMQQLCDYHWPGNVRELANVIERAVIITKGTNLDLNLAMQSFLVNNHINVKNPVTVKNPQDYTENLHLSRNDLIQREKIIQVLKETNGIIAGSKGAAIKLGLKRTTLLSRMQKLNISAKEVV